MYSPRSINVLIYVMIAIIFAVKNSNANDCLDQITVFGNISKDSNSTEAFTVFYNNLIRIRTLGKKKIFLKKYVDDLFEKATSNYDFQLLNNPTQWCQNNIGELKSKLGFTIPLDCHEVLRECNFKVKWHSKKALERCYNDLTFDLVKDNVVVLMYFQYLFKTFSPHIANSPAISPADFCNDNGNNNSNEIPDYQLENEINPIDTANQFQIADYYGSITQGEGSSHNIENPYNISSEYTFDNGQSTFNASTYLSSEQYNPVLDYSSEIIPDTGPHYNVQDIQNIGFPYGNDASNFPIQKEQELFYNLVNSQNIFSQQTTDNFQSKFNAPTYLPSEQYNPGKSPVVYSTDYSNPNINLKLPLSNASSSSQFKPVNDTNFPIDQPGTADYFGTMIPRIESLYNVQDTQNILFPYTYDQSNFPVPERQEPFSNLQNSQNIFSQHTYDNVQSTFNASTYLSSEQYNPVWSQEESLSTPDDLYPPLIYTYTSNQNNFPNFNYNDKDKNENP